MLPARQPAGHRGHNIPRILAPSVWRDRVLCGNGCGASARDWHTANELRKGREGRTRGCGWLTEGRDVEGGGGERYGESRNTSYVEVAVEFEAAQKWVRNIDER